uniref:Putative tick transposon n=1 Tax=Rhipicephalus microplus TaxID=6941 RepID=A0A6G5A9X6_RHIMP
MLKDASLLIQKIRIANRDSRPSPVMRTWKEELVEQYQRIMRASSPLSAAAWRCRRAPCAHPEVLRYARRALLCPPGSPAHSLNSPAPAAAATRSFQEFTQHFQSIAQSSANVCYPGSVSSHPLLKDLPHDSNMSNDVLLSPPSDDEIKGALDAMKKGSAPGPDGLPAEFYVQFWPIIGPTMSRVIRKCFQDITLPTSFHKGRITLVPKKDPMSTRPEDWRPITLLNVDYKLLANILVRRISPFLATLIAPHQVCSVPGREIHAHTWLTRDIIQYTISRCAQGLLVSLDQEKAFDFIEHGFIRNVLHAYGFPDNFIDLINAMYTNLESTLT